MNLGSRNECTPCCDGINPVRNVARVGEQTGLLLRARVKRMPSDARRSMLGVRMSGLPYEPSVQAPWLSVRMKTRLGGRDSADRIERKATKEAKKDRQSMFVALRCH